MRLVAQGLSNKAIARQLNVSEGTIKVHLHHIFQKLEINNRTSSRRSPYHYPDTAGSARLLH